jgi:hypothetical protein
VATLTQAKTRCPLYRRLGGSQGQSGRLRKISLPTEIQSPNRPARSKSLHRLSYSGPHTHVTTVLKDRAMKTYKRREGKVPYVLIPDGGKGLVQRLRLHCFWGRNVTIFLYLQLCCLCRRVLRALSPGVNRSDHSHSSSAKFKKCEAA